MSPALVRSVAIVAAAADQLNGELTIIANAVKLAATDDEDEQTRDALTDISASAQRCAWMTATLLNYAQRCGARPSAATVDQLINGPTP